MDKRLENDLTRFEGLLRKLEFEYDQFFAGQLRSIPLKTEAAIDGIIRSYSNRGIQNSTHRFRYTNLVARYNSFRQVWSRKVREKEEGRVSGRPVRAITSVRVKKTQQPFRRIFDVDDPDGSRKAIREVFEAYKVLREECGETTERLRAENFARLLSDKIKKMRESKKCDSVEIKIRLEKNKPRILVKPS